jgi:hypothetical protein
MLNKKVIASRIKKSLRGHPFTISFGVIPTTKYPMTKANPMLTIPVFSLRIYPIAIAASKASNDINGKFIDLLSLINILRAKVETLNKHIKAILLS